MYRVAILSRLQRGSARSAKFAAMHGRKCAGFTLIESIIAVGLVALGMISTLSLIAATRVHNSIEQERARAHQIISEEMERVRFELFSRIEPGQQITIWDNGTPDDDTDDSRGTLEVIMRDAAGTLLTGPPLNSGRVEVEVTLTWNPRGRLSGKTMRETLMTYVSP